MCIHKTLASSMSAPHPILPCGPAAEGYGPALPTVLPEGFPPMAAGSLVFIDGVSEPEPNSFKKRRTSPKIYTTEKKKPAYNYEAPTAGQYKYKQPAFFVDQTLARQDSVSLQTTGILTVKVRKYILTSVQASKATEGVSTAMPVAQKLKEILSFNRPYLTVSHETMTFEVTTTKDTPYEIKYKRIDKDATYSNEKITLMVPVHITPGQVLSYAKTEKVGGSNYTILKPMTKKDQYPAAIVLSAEDIDDDPNHCMCRVFVSNLFDMTEFTGMRPGPPGALTAAEAAIAPEAVQNTSARTGKRPNFLNFFIGKLTGGGTREKHIYDR